ncbi:MAG: VanZ family protein, partial [Clostridia bacterium]|nr:VanZ family protein [Clostridia bacterium]
EEEKITRDELDGAVRALAHVAEFFLLGAEAMLLVLLCSLRPIVAATFLPIFSCLAVGVIDESLQMLNDRSAQFVDIMKDFAGGVLGTLAIFAVYIIICKVKNKTK